MTETARLRLPELAAAQAQKHVTHNEALVALDTLVQISVLDKDLDTPPGSPAEGDCFIVASGGTGDWTGWDDRIARYEDGAWRSYLPGVGDGEGWLAYVQDEEAFYVLKPTGWEAFAGSGLGTAAYEDIGTSGDTVPKLDGANTFGNAQVIDTVSLVPLYIVTEHDGAQNGPRLILDRNSASPAASDLIGNVRYTGRNDADETLIYAQQFGRIVDPANGSEDGEFVVRAVSGGNASPDRFVVGGGAYVGAPTGGDQGYGTLNATAVYDDGALLTCMALQDEFLVTGTVDTGLWDSRVPDLVVPGQVEEIEVFEEIEQPVSSDREAPDGSLIRTIERKIVRRPRVDHIPVYDAEGNGIDMVVRPVVEKRVTPPATFPRRHEVAHLFKRMLDDGFDPRDPAQYVEKLRRDKALPGMPAAAEWRHNALSLGEIASRKWLALEMLALVVASHEDRISALEEVVGN